MALIHGGDVEGFWLEYGHKPLDFSANINPLGPPPGVARAVCESAAESATYPDPLCRRLTAAIARAEGLESEQVLCGNGAADLIYRLALALRPARALVLAPGFAEYELALASVGCVAERHYLKAGEGFALCPSVLHKLEPGLDVFFLCNPHNPTGLTVHPRLLRQIAARCAELGIVLALDECFNGLLDTPSDHTLRHCLHEYKTLLILDAFTKLYAMAGLRLGFALSANTQLLAAMRGAGQPWAVSTPAVAAGLAALADADYPARSRALIRAERAYLAAGLIELGCAELSGEANFLFFRSDIPRLVERLRARGVLIRDCANYAGLSQGYYRVAVRDHAENELLLTQLQVVAEERHE